MNDKFDELAKGLVQSVTRRGALKKFCLGLAGIALALVGLANNARGARGGFPSGHKCKANHQCASGVCWHNPEAPYPGTCL